MKKLSFFSIYALVMVMGFYTYQSQKVSQREIASTDVTKLIDLPKLIGAFKQEDSDFYSKPKLQGDFCGDFTKIRYTFKALGVSVFSDVPEHDVLLHATSDCRDHALGLLVFSGQLCTEQEILKGGAFEIQKTEFSMTERMDGFPREWALFKISLLNDEGKSERALSPKESELLKAKCIFKN